MLPLLLTCLTLANTRPCAWYSPCKQGKQKVEVSGEKNEGTAEAVSQLDSFLAQNGYYKKKKWRGRIPVLRALYLALDPDSPSLSLQIGVVCFSIGIRGDNVSSLLSFLLSLHYDGAHISSTQRSRLTALKGKFPFRLNLNGSYLNICSFDSDSDDRFELRRSELGALLELLTKSNWRKAEEAGVITGILKLALLPNGPLLLDRPTCLQVLPCVSEGIQAGCDPKLKGREREEMVLLVTELLRRLLDKGHEVRKAILHLRIHSSLPLLFSLYSYCKPVLRNLSRISSKMSSQPYFGEVFDNTVGSLALASALSAFPQEEDITTRLLFTLGNYCFLMGPTASTALLEASQFFPTLLSLFSDSLQSHSSTGINGCGGPSEVLLKVVFLVGNLGGNEVIGPAAARIPQLSSLLLSALNKGLSPPRCEEIIGNSLLAIHNISFHSSRPSTSQQKGQSEQLLATAETVHPVLMEEEISLVIEACNIMGNLSRDNAVRAWILEKKVDVMMGSLLTSSCRELRGSALGVLLNLSGDEEGVKALKSLNVPKKTICFLKEETECWNLCSLGCKLLFNLTLFGSLDDSEIADLSPWIIQATDEKWNKRESRHDKSQDSSWEEFCSVAVRLLEKISSPVASSLD